MVNVKIVRLRDMLLHHLKFSLMKLLTSLTLLLFVFTSSFAQNDQFFASADLFFKENVENGLINYQRVKENERRFNVLVEQVADFEIAGTNLTEQKAFYINAYNLLVIKQIADNYPVDGPFSIPGFFGEQTFTVAHREVTLDELEKKIIFKAFPDPRLHFLLVCAAVGCPPISAYAYMPDTLEEQIDQKTKETLNLPWYVRVHVNRALVSKVFDWYGKDFINDTTSIKSFINKYRDSPIPDGHELAYYEYDWTLNDSSTDYRFK